MMYLSKDERITLIKSTLSNLPTYMSLFPLPIGIANHIEKLQWDFLWGGFSEEFKFHLFSWSMVCSTILEKGLRVHNLLLFILEKWLWFYVHEKEALWGVVVWGGLCSNEINGLYGVGLWKNIKRGWGSSLETLDLRSVMALKLDYGMMCGVWIRPLR
jgi:hypothetical protein